MKQLNFLSNNSIESKQDNSCEPDKVNYWKLSVDGASRNNPGKAGAGIYIIKNNEKFLCHGFSLGLKTNNQAEYLALLVGIFFLKKYLCEDDIVMIISDSQLMVRQMTGHYKVKNADLIPLFKLSKKLLYGINYNIAHVLRDENKEADEMANLGIDKGKRLPQDFLDMLQEYEIQL
ncbi:MAG: RNase H family protein [candidate division TM6 bacterium GW2011_GWF2_30_66]|nr:MAG: RNase H family protein [candidate division TM6 bacterium GW2011_GWF2_30_66]